MVGPKDLGLSLWVEKGLFGLAGWGYQRIQRIGYLKVKEEDMHFGLTHFQNSWVGRGQCSGRESCGGGGGSRGSS